METVQKVEKSGNTLFNHMFSDENTKPNIVNIMQYTAIGIIPVLVLNRLMQHIFPEVDEKKNNLELSIEVIGQLTLLFVGIFMIDNLIRYFNVYSGEKYNDVSVLNMILPLMIILFSVPSKIGQKMQLLMDRILRGLNIESEQKKEGGGEKIEIRPTLPIMTDVRDMMGQNQMGDVPPALQSVATKPEKTSSTSIASLPSSTQSSNGRVSNNNTNFNNMFEPSTNGSSSGGLSFTAF